MSTPTSLNDVMATIEGCFTNGTFTLPADAFGTTWVMPDGSTVPAEIYNLINIYMDGDELVLTNASYTSTPNYIVVTGMGSNRPFGSTNVNVSFGYDPAKGGATMNLLATPQTGWNFAISFPSLDNTLLPELVFNFESSDGIYRGLYMASYDALATQFTPRTQYGLFFRADLQLTRLLAQLNWLLGGGTTLLVEGPINMHQGIPEMDLKAPTIFGELSLGYFIVPAVVFSITSQLIPSQTQDTQSASASAWMSFSTIIRFQTTTTRVDIPVSAVFLNRPTFLQFRANLTDAVYATLDQLAVLIGGADLSSFLDGVNLSDYVGLSDFILQVNPVTQSLMSISMGVRTAQPLPLIQDDAPGGYGNVITMNTIELSFRAWPPFNDPAISPNVSMAVFGEVEIFDNAQLEISAVYPDFIFNAELKEGTNLNLAQVVQYFIPTTFSESAETIADVPTINVTNFELTVYPSSDPASAYYHGRVAVQNDWPITLGPTTLLISDVSFSIDYANEAVQSAIAGRLVIGDNLATVTVDWALPGDLTITGNVGPALDLSTLIATYVSTQLAYTLPSIELANTSLLIRRFQDGGYFLAFGTTESSFGTVELEFAQTAADTGVTVGFALPAGWKLTDLSDAFDIGLLADLSFTNAALILSSFDNRYFSFRSLSGDHATVPIPYSSGGVLAGMHLQANLTLDPTADSAFGTVSKLLAGNADAPQTLPGHPGIPQDGTTYLKVALSIPSDYTQTNFLASLNGRFVFIRARDRSEVVVLNHLELDVRPGNEYLNLAMNVTIYVMGAELGLLGQVRIDGPEVDFLLQTTTPWVNPFGIQGLTINAMAAEFRFGRTIALGLEGAITIGTGATAITLIAAMEFNLEADFLPDVFRISESGRISFGAIIGSFVASKYVPSVLNEVVLYEFSLLIVANPAGWTDLLSGQHFGFGIAFSGMVSICGIVAKFAIQVDYTSGISANGEVDGPIHIGPSFSGIPAVTIARAVPNNSGAVQQWNQGPFITINSAHSPYTNMSVALRIWEISTIQLLATITDDGFYLEFDFTLGSLSSSFKTALSITAYIQNRNAFQFRAAVGLEIAAIDGIKVGDKILGSITSPISIAAVFQLNFGPGLQLGIAIGASFAMSGYRMTLPEMSASTTNLSSFSQIPTVFAYALADKLWDIGAALFRDADALFQYVKRGFMNLYNDIGDIMSSYLNLSINDAAVYLRSVMTILDYSVDDVATLLKTGFNALDTELAGAMKYAAFEAEQVAQVISNLYHLEAQAVAEVLKTVNYELGQIATALRNVFNYSAQEVAQFFKSVWNIADTLVNAALQAADYLASEIESAMKTAFGWFKSAANAIASAWHSIWH